jgi:CRP/FNR family transcriptional regulator, nitrogen oxide reductase regulator
MTTARVSAVRPPQFAILTAESNIAERLVLMCASALFAGLTRQQCLEIASCAKARTFARDELLFMQGQPVHNLMLIQAGSVKLTQLSTNGNEVILWMNSEGDVIGEHTDQSWCTHSCSARAMEQCRALTWEYARLQNLVTEYPQIRKNINQILSDRLRELEERFREVATEKVAKRLALTLLRLLKKVGKDNRGGVQISLSREELAQMTGTTLFTVSRILSKWGEEGFILPRREAVLVRDAERLGQIGDEED